MKELLNSLKIAFRELAPDRIEVAISLEDWAFLRMDPFDLPEGWDWESDYILVKD